MNTPTNHEQLSKQEGEIWTLLQTMRREIWTLLQTMNSSQNKRQKYEHSYKPWTAHKTRGRNMNTYKPWTALKTRGRNMNTPTNHEQLSKQETEIWTLLQTMNSSLNKREEYEHSYIPWTALKTRGRNMNTPTNHEQLFKTRGRNMNTPLVLRARGMFMVCRSVHISLKTREQFKYVGVFILLPLVLTAVHGL